MTLPMTAGQQSTWDAGHCPGCGLYIATEDALTDPDTGRPWCEPCWYAVSARDAEESSWCDCDDRLYCPGPHRPPKGWWEWQGERNRGLL